MFHSDKAAETTPLSFLRGRKVTISPSRAREAFASLQSLLHSQCVSRIRNDIITQRSNVARPRMDVERALSDVSPDAQVIEQNSFIRP